MYIWWKSKVHRCGYGHYPTLIKERIFDNIGKVVLLLLWYFIWETQDEWPYTWDGIGLGSYNLIFDLC